MALQPHPLHQLQNFLPDGAFDMVKVYFENYPIALSIKRERKTVYGDYRAPYGAIKVHRISVNGNLNSQHFLITLLHEIAHMLVFVYFKKRVLPHGDEWKQTFSKVLQPFMQQQYFKQDVMQALNGYIKNPAASSCTDLHLFKALARYNAHQSKGKVISDLPDGARFIAENGKRFQLIEKLRTRYKCRNLDNGHIYLFQSWAAVELMVD